MIRILSNPITRSSPNSDSLDLAAYERSAIALVSVIAL